ncbi:hypothetical protein CTI12_AA405420 [Artemisia annua]|uniref:KIB1-4 beta-propeller domain-containing protein n=1 Tax=Artemisia annua TaxID=35608 RepID=A0A2U1M9C4_ARTAN|nr:hypothetical protein CTI12_AA405420 [Artemisia annua]
MNMTSMMWEEMEDLKDAVFFINLGDDVISDFYMPNISSELGGYIHVLDEMAEVMYSTNVKDKTISISSVPRAVPKRYLSLWECSLPGDHRELYFKQEENKKDEITVTLYRDNKIELQAPSVKNSESHLLNIPLDVLGKIIDFCVGIEFLNFRATCKSCLLAAPMLRWDNGNRSRLETYSLVSPWLMVVDKHRGIISFTDPMFGDNYFIKTPQKLIGDLRIHYSKYGWLLIEKYETTNERNPFVFFNPCTGDIRELPGPVPFARSFCFSAPPTSPNCMVVGLGNYCSSWCIHIHCVSREPLWRILAVDSGDADCDPTLRYPAFYGKDVYALLADGRLVVFEKIEDTNASCSGLVLAKSPRSCRGPSTRYFLVKRDQHLLLVIMGAFGESLEVFKFNDLTKEWEEINSLGRHMIIISDKTCLCIEAKMQEMENKIFVSRLHSDSEKIVFYSLETGRYHTSNGKNIKGHKTTFDKLEPIASEPKTLAFLIIKIR